MAVGAVVEPMAKGKDKGDPAHNRQLRDQINRRLEMNPMMLRFRSIMSQTPTAQQLIPTLLPEVTTAAPTGPQALYEYEPSEEEILAALLPQNLAIQIYGALLQNVAGFFGSQMTAMDSATRNAGEMINKLTLNYNRTRQANITRELIEIISGAEAV